MRIPTARPWTLRSAIVARRRCGRPGASSGSTPLPSLICRPVSRHPSERPDDAAGRHAFRQPRILSGAADSCISQRVASRTTRTRRTHLQADAPRLERLRLDDAGHLESPGLVWLASGGRQMCTPSRCWSGCGRSRSWPSVCSSVNSSSRSRPQREQFHPTRRRPGARVPDSTGLASTSKQESPSAPSRAVRILALILWD